MLLGLFSAIGANAQFVNPVTPDEYSQCDAPDVENTGTSTLDQVQVTVHDGSYPSIIFTDYSSNPPQMQCFTLEAFNRGARVHDPDVVWDYAGSGYLLVVYESDYQNNQGIWSEVWDWNGGSPVVETAYGSFAGMEEVQAGSGQSYPNVDADTKENAVVVWERSSTIQAVHFDFQTLTFSPNFYTVNNCTGAARSWEPDVALRQFNGIGYVDFVYVVDNGGNNEVRVLLEETNLVASQPIPNCLLSNQFHTVVPPITYTSIHNPRIAMPYYFTTGPSIPSTMGWDANVVYGLRDGGQSFIGTSSRWSLFGGCVPSGTGFYCVPQSYSDPVPGFGTNTEWIEEVITDFANITTPAGPPFDAQLVPPIIELSSDENTRPVTSYAGDLLPYMSWNWTDLFTSPAPRFGLSEILMRRMGTQPDGNFSIDPGPPQYDYEMYIPAPTMQEYYVVGEGFTFNYNQGIVSSAGDVAHNYFAFYDFDVQQMVCKRTPAAPASAVRLAEQMQANRQSLSRENQFNFRLYPNPSLGEVHIDQALVNSDYLLIDIHGKRILTGKVPATRFSLNLQAMHVSPGLYILNVWNAKGSLERKKILLQ